MTLTVGSLFSGIGGLDLGLERAGMRVIWQSEIDPYATRVLAKHWPGVPNHGDIKRINWRDVVRPDVICGGYPCQPFSTAGQRKGEEDPRHLWPWVREAIRILRPRYAILENVRGHLSLGGTTVLSEIAALGYSAEWRIVSAASVGANHRRDRIIIVAYPNGEDEPDGPVDELGVVADTDGIGSQRSRPKLKAARTPRGSQNKRQLVADPTSEPGKHERQDNGAALVTKYTPVDAGSDSGGDDESADGQPVADPEVFGSDGREPRQRGSQNGSGRTVQVKTRTGGRDLSDAESRVDVRGIGSSGHDRGEVFGGENLGRGTAGYAGGQWWEIEPDVGRVADGVPSRVDRLKGLGNAVVPQVAEVIGRLVVAHHAQNPD